MEPSYLAGNGYMDAMAIAWLLQNDCVFFDEEDIAWNKDEKRHEVRGIRLNAAKVDEIPVFMSGAEGNANGILDFLTKLGQQPGMSVARRRIHKALYRAIGKGDLTGITLFNLLARSKALVIGRPSPDEYTVAFDTNLAAGIPGFPGLVGNLVKFMREYNEIAGAFTVRFVGARNFDFINEWLGGDTSALDSPAGTSDDDAVLELVSGEGFSFVRPDGTRVEVRPGNGGGEAGGPAGSDAEAAGDDGDGERELLVSMLKLQVTLSQLAGAEYPAELLEQLDRAEAGDESVDLEALAAGILEQTPDGVSADASALSVSGENRIEGPAFSIAVPDGWQVEEGSDALGLSHSFTAFPGGGGPGTGDQVIYLSRPRGEEIEQGRLEYGTPEFCRTVILRGCYAISLGEGMGTV